MEKAPYWDVCLTRAFQEGKVLLEHRPIVKNFSIKKCVCWVLSNDGQVKLSDVLEDFKINMLNKHHGRVLLPHPDEMSQDEVTQEPYCEDSVETKPNVTLGRCHVEPDEMAERKPNVQPYVLTETKPNVQHYEMAEMKPNVQHYKMDDPQPYEMNTQPGESVEPQPDVQLGNMVEPGELFVNQQSPMLQRMKIPNEGDGLMIQSIYLPEERYKLDIYLRSKKERWC